MNTALLGWGARVRKKYFLLYLRFTHKCEPFCLHIRGSSNDKYLNICVRIAFIILKYIFAFYIQMCTIHLKQTDEFQ